MRDTKWRCLNCESSSISVLNSRAPCNDSGFSRLMATGSDPTVDMAFVHVTEAANTNNEILAEVLGGGFDLRQWKVTTQMCW